jgi:hypothetical protein
MQAWLEVIRSFAQPTFLSTGNMMNARGLAFNLERFLPGFSSWPVWILLTGGIATSVLVFWARTPLQGNLVWLMLLTLAGTFIVSWHSNLYLWVTLIPFFLILDIDGKIPLAWIAFWIIGIPAIYLLISAIHPELANPAVGMGMLVANLLLILLSYRQMVNQADPAQDTHLSGSR